MTHKHFIAAILAAAISITALSSAPARAGNDTAKIIAGVAALAIIGAAVADASRDRNVYVTRNAYPHRGYGWQARRNHVRQERLGRHWQQHQHQRQHRHHRHHRHHHHDRRW